MRSAFVKVNKVPTRITCWGKWIEESFDEGDSKDIVLMICGNPGITGYYEKFLETIHRETGYHVWILSHAGHETPELPTVMEMPSLDSNPDLYNLKGQIAHKIDFIKQFVPSDCHVHVLGHSIGAYMCTNMLNDPLLKEKVNKAYLLFPTIERMAVSPNGKFYTRIVQKLASILLFLAYFFSFFPQIIKNLLGRVVLYLHGTNANFLKPTLTLAAPDIAKKIMFLADDEMASVKERQDSLITAHQDKLVAYYGQTDGWVPMKYSEDLRRDFPGVKVEIARKEFEHAYVLKHSREVGVAVSELIKAH